MNRRIQKKRGVGRDSASPSRDDDYGADQVVQRTAQSQPPIVEAVPFGATHMTTEASGLVQLIGGKRTPTATEFRELVQKIDSHEVLAKVFLLEGVPYVFEGSPMKYVIFREQVAERFGVGSQDVCIVGSAKLGYSPSGYKFGKTFEEESDVDVVIISDSLFYTGSRALFAVLNQYGPTLRAIRTGSSSGDRPSVNLNDWRNVKDAIRNFVYENLNPGLLPHDHPLRVEIFSKINSTAGLFLALEPRVFVSRIRCRVFRNWKAAENYYANSLRETRNYFADSQEVEPDIEDADDAEVILPVVADAPPPQTTGLVS